MNIRKPIIYTLLFFSGSKITRNLKVIEKVSKFNKRDLKKYQDKKLSKLLLHAYENVPYYKKILEESEVVVGGKVNLKNYSKIPILTKKIIRREGKNLYSKDYKKRGHYINTSGGSTGEPVKLIQDKNYSDWNIANKMFIKKVYDQDIGDREMRLWGSERDIIEGRESAKNRFRNWLYNRRDFNSFRFDNKKLNKCLKEWNRFKPLWVEAYVQSADEFSKYILKKDNKLYSPRGVLVSAGKLYQKSKNNISKATNSVVVDRYGSREVGDIAFSCKSNFKHLHICVWNNMVEVVDSRKNKPIGAAIVTNLNNYSMPLVRYQLGDVLTLGKNNCRRHKTPIIEEIKGREVSFLRNSAGESIDGEYFTHLFYGKEWVEQFKVVQDQINHIEINLIQSKKFKIIKTQQSEINKLIRLVMGRKCKIDWVKRKRINETKSGKHIYVVNKLK